MMYRDIQGVRSGSGKTNSTECREESKGT